MRAETTYIPVGGLQLSYISFASTVALLVISVYNWYSGVFAWAFRVELDPLGIMLVVWSALQVTHFLQLHVLSKLYNCKILDLDLGNSKSFK